MRHILAIALLVLAGVAGAYLLGKGLTGNVVSESCCFGPECPIDQLCDVAEPIVEYPAQTHFMLSLGGLLMALAVLLIALHVLVEKHSSSEKRRNA